MRDSIDRRHGDDNEGYDAEAVFAEIQRCILECSEWVRKRLQNNVVQPYKPFECEDHIHISPTQTESEEFTLMIAIDIPQRGKSAGEYSQYLLRPSEVQRTLRAMTPELRSDLAEEIERTYTERVQNAAAEAGEFGAGLNTVIKLRALAESIARGEVPKPPSPWSSVPGPL